MKITFHFLIDSRNSQKNSRYFTKTQEILPKTQENFRKTQVFANSELEIVAEKRPKKEPAVMVRLLSGYFQECEIQECGNGDYILERS